MSSKYRPIEFNAQAVSSEIMSYRDLRRDFYEGIDSAYCLDAPSILPSGLVTMPVRRDGTPMRGLPCIHYVYRDKA